MQAPSPGNGQGISGSPPATWYHLHKALLPQGHHAQGIPSQRVCPWEHQPWGILSQGVCAQGYSAQDIPSQGVCVWVYHAC